MSNHPSCNPDIKPLPAGGPGPNMVLDTSLQVTLTRCEEIGGLQRHDLRRPDLEGDGFELRDGNKVNSPVLNTDGTVVSLLNRIENVTEFVRLEQDIGQALLLVSDLDARSREATETSGELGELIETLEQSVAERTASLQKSVEKLREENIATTRERDQVRNLLEIAGVMILALDTEGRVTLINRRGCEILGRPEEEILGKDWVGTFLPERIRKDMNDVFHQMMAGENREFKHNENPVLTRDGGERHILWSNQVIMDGAGRITGVLSSGEDISERERAEEALREAGRRQAFLLAFGDALRDLADIREIVAVASELIGRHLGVNGVVYCEIDPTGQYSTIRADWTDGTVPSTAGTHWMDDFGIGDIYRRGLIRRTDDITADHDEAKIAAHCALRIRASLGVPFFRGGRLSAVLAVHSARPRAWTDADTELVRQAGDRTWAAVERARAEGALHESEAEARSFMENMVDPCAICETVYAPDGKPIDIRLVEVNAALAREQGRPAAEIAGRTAFEILPELTHLWFDRFFEVGRTGKATDFEELFPALGRWYRIAAFPVRGGRIAVMLRNITEQKQAEEALRESEELFGKVINNANDAVCLVERSPEGPGRYLLVNDKAVQMLGYSKEELLQMTLGDIVPMEIQKRVIPEVIKKLLKDGHSTFESAHRRKNGSIYPIEVSLHTFRYKGMDVDLSISRDITERKDAEETLHESEERYRSLVENSLDAVLLTSPEGSILAANTGASRIFGMTEEELIRDGRASVVDQSDPRFTAACEERARTGLFRGEMTLRRKDGSLFPGEVTSSLFTDRSGAVMTTMIVRDITERKEAEKSLRNYTERVQTSNEELQRFAYVASHDLQAPLRSIVSFSQLLDRQYRGRLDRDADEYLQFIIDSGKRMQALIKDLLMFSQIETQEALPLAPTDAGAVVADAVHSLEIQIQEAGAVVTVDPLPIVMADPSQLEQVFTNLIGNAIKYRQPDVPAVIGISAVLQGDWWEFAVRDNGIGIEPEYSDRIFEMFSRLHTKGEVAGTGIGLAIVRKIVGRHGGRIWVEPTPGEGSTFCFTLPGESMKRGGETDE